MGQLSEEIQPKDKLQLFLQVMNLQKAAHLLLKL
jgi:hypothetical protein